MKKQLLTTMLVGVLMAACQSQDIEPTLPAQDAPQPTTEEVVVTPISEDVNSAEVKNILGSLFGKERGRSSDYTVSLLKDKEGKDRVICVNYSDNGGFALISAEKTHTPILAYAEEGNFTDAANLPFPLNEWMESTMEGIAESETLPADSLQKIANIWRRYEVVKPFLKSRAYEPEPDHSRLINITPEESVELFHKMKPYLDEWATQDCRVYSIDDYPNSLTFEDKFQLAGYVQANIFAAYAEDYWLVTVVREVDHGNHSYFGSRFNVNWSQGAGYNQSFQLRPGYTDEHIPVGCGPVALGQLMYGYRYPKFFNWDDMSTSIPGNKVASDFLLDVFYKTNASYKPDKNMTSTSLDDLESGLKAYGYSCKKIGSSSINSGTIASGCPAIMSSLLDNDPSKGHAWLIEGGGRSETWTTAEVWTFTYPDEFKCIYTCELDHFYSTGFYVNWGWGSHNGNYGLDHMIPKDFGYSSNKLRGAIINITHP